MFALSRVRPSAFVTQTPRVATANASVIPLHEISSSSGSRLCAATNMGGKYYINREDNSDTGEELSLKEQGFYHTRAWRKTRKLVLARDNYLCQLRISPECRRYADTVHHIKELEDYPELALDMSNLTSCCWKCHELTKTRSEHQRKLKKAKAKGVRIITIGSDDGGEF